MMIITPTKHNGNSTIIQKMLTNYQRHQGIQVNLEDLQKSTIIVAYDKHRGIRGGAWLTQKSLSEIPDVFKQHPSLKKKQKIYWECSGINFNLDDNDPALLYPANLYILRQAFYEDLYECLINFGVINDVTFVVTHHASAEHARLKHIGKWPFNLELSSSKMPEMFFGLLPITLEAQDLYHTNYEERARTVEK